MKSRILISISAIALTLCSILFLVQDLHAQRPEPEDTVELMNQIRRDKFDIYLPQVMR